MSHWWPGESRQTHSGLDSFVIAAWPQPGVWQNVFVKRRDYAQLADINRIGFGND